VETLSPSLTRFIDAAGLRKRLILGMATHVWGDCVGRQIAQHAYVERVRQGTLYVVTDSPVWSQELSYLKPKIIDEVNSRLDEPVVTEIRFRTQAKSQARESTRTPLYPWNRHIDSVNLSDSHHETVASCTDHLRNRELQATLRSWAERMLKLREWDKRHPVRYCVECNKHFRSHRKRCPMCNRDVSLERKPLD